MEEIMWSLYKPQESRFYWAKWNPVGANFVVEVDSEGVWMPGEENPMEGMLTYGPRIPYLWE
jgi:hypothetical protein